MDPSAAPPLLPLAEFAGTNNNDKFYKQMTLTLAIKERWIVVYIRNFDLKEEY